MKKKVVELEKNLAKRKMTEKTLKRKRLKDKKIEMSKILLVIMVIE